MIGRLLLISSQHLENGTISPLEEKLILGRIHEGNSLVSL